MKVKAFRIAAWLLIANFAIIWAFALLGPGPLNYTHLLVQAAILFGTCSALYSPRPKGWIVVAAYCVYVLIQHGLGLWVVLGNPEATQALKTTSIALLAIIDALIVVAAVLVFKPSNFAAFTAQAATPAADADPPR